MDISAIALGGLQTAQSNFERAAARLATADVSDTVDLSTAAVDLITARNQFEANIKVMHTANETFKKTLDLLA
jgi:flagellar hook protein FlgE